MTAHNIFSKVFLLRLFRQSTTRSIASIFATTDKIDLDGVQVYFLSANFNVRIVIMTDNQIFHAQRRYHNPETEWAWIKAIPTDADLVEIALRTADYNTWEDYR